MEKFLGLLLVCSFGRPILAKERYDIATHVRGKEAQAIYEALQVPEQKEKADFSAPELRIYKIGQNILCLKTLSSVAAAENTANYFCSAGFDSKGISEASGLSIKH